MKRKKNRMSLTPPTPPPPRETVSIAMHYLDTYLATSGSGGKKLFQLASMSSLFIAAKLQEQKPIAMADLVSLSRGVFKAEDLKNMEKRMLMKLRWNLHPATAMSYVRIFLHYLPVDSDQSPVLRNLLETSEFFTELAVCEYFFVQFHQATVAMSSILNAIKNAQHDVRPEAASIEAFTRDVEEHLKFSVSSSEVKTCCTALMKMYMSSVADQMDMEEAADNEVSDICGSPNEVKSRDEFTPSPTSVVVGNGGVEGGAGIANHSAQQPTSTTTTSATNRMKDEGGEEEQEEGRQAKKFKVSEVVKM